jgi:hypothetical protein
MQVDGRLPIGHRLGHVVIHSLTANIGQFGRFVTALYLSFSEGRMFSRWIVKNINSARGTVYCCKTRIPCWDQLVICGLHGLSNCYLVFPDVGLSVFLDLAIPYAPTSSSFLIHCADPHRSRGSPQNTTL